MFASCVLAVCLLSVGLCQPKICPSTTCCDVSCWFPQKSPLSRKDAVLCSYVRAVRPAFGPVAGGTAFTVTGQFHVAVTHVRLQDSIMCLVTHRTPQRLHALTPSVMDSLANIRLEVDVILSGNTRLETGRHFIFKHNPILQHLAPLETITVGGTVLTVDGAFLTSVADPVLEVTTHASFPDLPQYRQRSRKNCEPVTPTEMICTIPHLAIPQQYLTARENQINTHSSLFHNQNHDKVNHKTDYSEITFYVGFILDGLPTYSNLSHNAVLKEYGQLDVYFPPKFEENQTLDLLMGGSLSLKGSSLRRGVSIRDYRVDIGDTACRVTDLSDNLLHCMTDPDDAITRSSQSTDQIRVCIGLYLCEEIGHVVYRDGLPFWLIAILIAIAYTILSLFILAFIKFCTKRTRFI